MRPLTVISLCAFSLVAAPVWAGKAENCATFGEIATEAAKLRGSGLYTVEQAAQTLSADFAVQGAEFGQLAPQIAAWVWSLPEDALGPGVGKAMRDQCMAQ